MSRTLRAVEGANSSGLHTELQTLHPKLQLWRLARLRLRDPAAAGAGMSQLALSADAGPAAVASHQKVRECLRGFLFLPSSALDFDII